MTMDYSDQARIFDAEAWLWPVHLVGAGGINNTVGPLLAKMGVKEIHVWDDDNLEPRNLPTEVAYSCRMVGKPKVAAMADAIYNLVPKGVEVEQHRRRVDKDTNLDGVVICGVDSMKSRKTIWQAVKRRTVYTPFFIDGRSAGENVAIFAFSPADFKAAEDYETWLFDDALAMKLGCGARNIGYISYYMASEIGRILTRFSRGLPVDFYRACNFGTLR